MVSEVRFDQLVSWITEAGLTGQSEAALLQGFCERARAAGIPVDRVNVFIDTLHPVHEGRLFAWTSSASIQPEKPYGRTSRIIPNSGNPDSNRWRKSPFPSDMWQQSPFYRLREDGASMLRRRLTSSALNEFGIFPDLHAEGHTDYLAIVNYFAEAGSIADMDCLYSSWATKSADAFTDAHIATLQRLLPFLALAIKSVSLTRMTETLMQTYLGRDAARRVLSGGIMRGVSDTIDAVVWFSDLRGFTRITDTMPEHVIPLLSEYADVVVSAIHDHGGDVLKFVGDGTLAIFTGDDRRHACAAALDASIMAQQSVRSVNARRGAEGLPVTDMYLGLHVGEMFYGNIGSEDRLDFTVIGPAVNEVSRIAAMCRSIEQPVLVSSAFADVGNNKGRLVSVGRYALRGVGRPQELFALDPVVLAQA